MLRGVRVLDLSGLLPGPFATQLLADLGAEVIKVEGPRGDGVRLYPPFAKDGTSAMFHALNRGKKSLLLDLKQPEARDALRGLLPSANVLVEGFRPGVLERLLEVGSCDELLERHPGLVVARISGYGQTGAHAHDPGHDINYCARAGVLGLMREPAALPVQVADLAGGAWPAALQIVAALYGGGGAVVDVSMTEGAHALMALPLARHSCSGERVEGGRDLLAGQAPCYRVYAAAEGTHVAVGTLEPHFWDSMVAALELPHLAGRGFEPGEAVAGELQRALLARPAREWETFFAEHDVPVNAVATPAEAAADDRVPHIAVDVEGQELRLPGSPMRLARPSSSPAPALGAHNEEILGPVGIE